MAPPRKPMRPEIPQNEAPIAKTINKVRTPHGTRVARRITCTKCGQSDTIDFAPKDPANVLCRKCAFETYGVLDPDDVSLRTRRVKCIQCKQFFEQTLDPKRPETGPAICRDCKSGVETVQGDKAKAATRVSDKVVRARRKPAED